MTTSNIDKINDRLCEIMASFDAAFKTALEGLVDITNDLADETHEDVGLEEIGVIDVIDIHRCDEHDHRVVYVNGELVISNDESTENLIRVCKHLGMKVNQVTHTRNEFEKKYC